GIEARIVESWRNHSDSILRHTILVGLQQRLLLGRRGDDEPGIVEYATLLSDPVTEVVALFLFRRIAGHIVPLPDAQRVRRVYVGNAERLSQKPARKARVP